MAEPSQVSSFSQYGQGVDRSDARNLLQAQKIRARLQQLGGEGLDCAAAWKKDPLSGVIGA